MPRMGTEQVISEHTRFDQGDMFVSEQQVRDYFTVANQRIMFDDDGIDDQEQLDAWADQVIENGWHMAHGRSALTE